MRQGHTRRRIEIFMVLALLSGCATPVPPTDPQTTTSAATKSLPLATAASAAVMPSAQPVTPVHTLATVPSATSAEAIPTSTTLAEASPPPTPTGTPAPCVPTAPSGSSASYAPHAPVRTEVGHGHVLRGVITASPDCAPVAGAQIELWLVGPNAEYDAAHRATLFADEAGDYRFESNFPPPYPGRPPHIHIRVSAAGFRTLVTQFYPSKGETEGVFEIVLKRTPAAHS